MKACLILLWLLAAFVAQVCVVEFLNERWGNSAIAGFATAIHVWNVRRVTRNAKIIDHEPEKQ